MEYASPVMNPRNIRVNLVMRNCSRRKKTRSIDETDMISGSPAAKFSHLGRENNPSTYPPPSFANSPRNSLIGRPPPPFKHAAAEQAQDDWSPEATFWLTLMIVIVLGIFMTGCCIMKQRKDDNMFRNRRRARRNRRLFSDRSLPATSTTSSTKESTDLAHCSQETCCFNAPTTTTRLTTDDCETTAEETASSSDLVNTIDIPDSGNEKDFGDRKTENCGSYSMMPHPDKKIPGSADTSRPGEICRILAWQLEQQEKSQHASLFRGRRWRNKEAKIESYKKSKLYFGRDVSCVEQIIQHV